MRLPTAVCFSDGWRQSGWKRRKRTLPETAGDLDNQPLARLSNHVTSWWITRPRLRHGNANRRVLNRHNVRLVLVTRRQVQHQTHAVWRLSFCLFRGNIGDFELFPVSGDIIGSRFPWTHLFYPKTKIPSGNDQTASAGRNQALAYPASAVVSNAHKQSLFTRRAEVYDVTAIGNGFARVREEDAWHATPSSSCTPSSGMFSKRKIPPVTSFKNIVRLLSTYITVTVIHVVAAAFQLLPFMKTRISTLARPCSKRFAARWHLKTSLWHTVARCWIRLQFFAHFVLSQAGVISEVVRPARLLLEAEVGNPPTCVSSDENCGTLRCPESCCTQRLLGLASTRISSICPTPAAQQPFAIAQ